MRGHSASLGVIPLGLKQQANHEENGDDFYEESRLAIPIREKRIALSTIVNMMVNSRKEEKAKLKRNVSADRLATWYYMPRAAVAAMAARIGVWCM